MIKEADLSPPSKAALKAADDLIFSALIEFADVAGSLSRSAAEAAFREERHELRIQLLKLRATVVTILKTYNDLVAGEASAK